MCNFSIFQYSRYVTALYFIFTTAATIGYGDICGGNVYEVTFLIFLEFTAICIFSLITGNITSMKA